MGSSEGALVMFTIRMVERMNVNVTPKNKLVASEKGSNALPLALRQQGHVLFFTNH
jgi:hypothetical protein